MSSLTRAAYCLLLLIAPTGVMGEDDLGWPADDLQLPDNDAGPSEFLQLAQLAQVGSAAARVRFATVALDEVMLAYGLELEAVHEIPPETLDREARVLRWEASTSAYVERLVIAAKLVEQSNDVNVLIQADGSVMLVIADVSVMVSTPRMADQRDLERRITDMLCPEIPCTLLVDANSFVEQPLRQRGRWEATSGAPVSYQTADGWRCEFAAMERYESKARICRRLVSEIQQLATTLMALVKQKRVIDWQGITVSENERSSLHQIKINANQSIPLWLPMLSAAGESFGAWIDVVKLVVERQDRPRTLTIPDDYVQMIHLGS